MQPDECALSSGCAWINGAVVLCLVRAVALFGVAASPSARNESFGSFSRKVGGGDWVGAGARVAGVFVVETYFADIHWRFTLVRLGTRRCASMAERAGSGSEWFARHVGSHLFRAISALPENQRGVVERLVAHSEAARLGRKPVGGIGEYFPIVDARTGSRAKRRNAHSGCGRKHRCSDYGR